MIRDHVSKSLRESAVVLTACERPLAAARLSISKGSNGSTASIDGFGNQTFD